MKKLWIIGMLTLVLALVAAGSQAALSAPSTVTPGGNNLLTNPGFEAGDASGWTVTGDAASGVATDGTPIPDFFGPPTATVEVRSGQYAFHNLTAGTAFPPVGSTLTQTAAVLPNTSYEVGFYDVHPFRAVGASSQSNWF